MKIINKTNSEHYNWGMKSEGWHFLKRDDLSIIYEEIPPGDSETKHFHKYSRQFFYILNGMATMEIGNEIVNLGENEGIEIDPEVHHKFINNSNNIIKILVVSMPKSHGDKIIVE